MFLRVATQNLWGIREPLERRLKLAEVQLHKLDLDVLCLQEVRPLPDGKGRTTAHLLAESLGMQCVYEVAMRWTGRDLEPGGSAGEEGLAILSRHAVAEHRVTRLPGTSALQSRILLSACLETNVGETWSHCTHLNYGLADGLRREEQVLAIDATVAAIETDRPHILCGDFNATPDSDEMRFLRGLATLDGRRTHYQDAWLRHHPEEGGSTWCTERGPQRARRSMDVDRRLDYIYVSTRKKDGRGTILESDVVLGARDDDGTCASDHLGVFARIDLGGAVLA